MVSPADDLKALAGRIAQLQGEVDSGSFTNAGELASLRNHVKDLQQRHSRPQVNGSSNVASPRPFSPPVVSFTPDQSATLTHQILAYKLLAQNKPLPAHIEAAIFKPGEALRQSQVALGKVGSNEEMKEEEVLETAEAVRLRVLAENDPSVNDVEDPSSLVYPYNSFSNPLDLHLIGKPSHRTLHIPTLLPPGLDPFVIAEERNRFINARVNQRISELESLPSNLSQSNPLSNNSTYMASQKIKALIELKSLNLLARQKALRQDVIRGFNQASSLSLASDRSNLRRFKKQTLRDARQTEMTERSQKQGRETRAKQKHSDHLVEITDHGKRLDAAHRLHASKFAKLGRSLLKFHADAERDELKRIERVSKERLRALRADDEEGYLALIDTAKDTRITHLLRQTDSFLDSLANAVVAQQSEAQAYPKARGSAAVIAVVPIEVEGETVDEGRFGAAPVFQEEVKDKVDYYNVAHAIKETITEQPKMLIGGQLKSYQLKGLEWMISLYNNRVNGILADEMGLGKTIQTIALITFLIESKKQNGPFLVIVPLSTMPNWIMEFEKWAPAVKMVSYKGSPTQRKVAQNEIRGGNFQVLLTTYEYIIKDRPLLAKIKWVHMIIDEGHRMKNSSSKLSITLTQYYSSRYRLILTGTPLQNNLPELWALLNFVLPKIFSSGKTFEEWFNTPFANTGGQDKIEVNEEETLLVIRRLHKVLRPFLLRRLKKDVEADLPDKVERVIKCRMSSLQLKLTRQIKEHGMIFTNGPADGKTKATGIRGLQNQIMQLRKICNHPFTFPEVERSIDPTGTTNITLYRVAGKFEILDRILPKLFARNHRVLMFFQMTTVMTIFEDYLNFRGVKHLRLDGTTKHEDRSSLLKAFNAPGSIYPIFILSTRAGGLGLNLQSADTVIIFDSDWNPHQDLQAQDRAHRIGQKKEVRILRLVTERSVEEQVMAGASKKIEMDKKIIQAGRYDNKSTAEERDEYLRALMDAEGDDPEEEDEMDEAEALNEAIARSDEERILFAQMDRDRKAEEERSWLAAGHFGKPQERLIQEHELPEVYRMEHESQVVVDEVFEDRRSRNKTAVHYDDGLSEEQWVQAVEQEQDPEEVAQMNRQRKAAARAAMPAGNISSPGSSQGAASDDDDSRGKRKRNGQSSSPSFGEEDDDDHSGKRQKTQLTQEQIQMKQIFDKIMDVLDDEDHPTLLHQRTGIFAALPSKSAYPDYYHHIKKPISLKEIKSKITRSSYSGVHKFQADLRLMLDNARIYNVAESVVYEDADYLQKVFDQLYDQLTRGSGLPGAE